MRRGKSVASLLHDAQNEAGDRAVAAAKRADYVTSRQWRSLAAELARLLRDAVTIEARGQ